MNKTWIKLKRGIIEPEHRKKLGIRIWLYIHMLDIVDWATGTIDDWTDANAAKAMDMPKRTVEKQRQKLEEDGYISCKQSIHRQVITIHKWTNPREYSGEVYNDHGTQNVVPTQPEGTQDFVPYVSTKMGTIYHYSHIKKHIYEYPEHLRTMVFLELWDEFHLHREQIKKPMTELAGKRMLTKLGKYPEQVAVDMLGSSIENGWQGVFEPKGYKHRRNGNQNLPEGI